MTSLLIDTHPTDRSAEPNTTAFRRRIGAGFWGLSALYGVYAVGGFFALAPEASIPYRLVLVFGTATFPLTVLFAPAVFVAALDDLHLFGPSRPGVRQRHIGLLVLVALAAGLASAIGPILFDYALAVTQDVEHVLVPQEGVLADANTRLMIPPALTLFVVVAGLAGAVVGRLTTGLADAFRILTRWVAGVLLVGVFWVTLVVAAELITMHGVLSPIWLALAPPLVPFILTSILARDDCVRIARSIIDRIRYRHERLDPLILDDLVTAIRRADDADSGTGGTTADHQHDPEMVELLTRLRGLAGPSDAAEESRVRGIVSALAVPPPGVVRDVPQRAEVGLSPGRLQTAGAVVGCWACLSVALLLLGGAAIVPPTIASASISGVLGAWATLHIACREKARALTSAPV